MFFEVVIEVLTLCDWGDERARLFRQRDRSKDQPARPRCGRSVAQPGRERVLDLVPGYVGFELVTLDHAAETGRLWVDALFDPAQTVIYL